MHAEISNFLEAHGIPDHHNFADGGWVAEVYTALATNLFPGSQPSQINLPQKVAKFAYLRALLAVIGIQISYRDLDDQQTPDLDQVHQRLHQAGEYLRFRAEVLESAPVCALRERFELLQELNDLEAVLNPEIETLEAEMAKEREHYDALQGEVNTKLQVVRRIAGECETIDKNRLEATTAYEAKIAQTETLETKIDVAKAAWDKLSPFMDADKLVNSVEQLGDAKKRLAALREQNSRVEAQSKLYKAALEDLSTLEALLPSLLKTKEEFAETTAKQEEVARKLKEQEAKAAARSQHEKQLQRELVAARAKIQLLRDQERSLTNDMEKQRIAFEQEKLSLLQQKEECEQQLELKAQEGRDQRDASKRQLELNAQVEKMLESEPKRLKKAEDRLDDALGVVIRWEAAMVSPEEKSPENSQGSERDTDTGASSPATSP